MGRVAEFCSYVLWSYNTFEIEIDEMQPRFRPGVRTREGMFNLRTIFAKYLKISKNNFFIDNEKSLIMFVAKS